MFKLVHIGKDPTTSVSKMTQMKGMSWATRFRFLHHVIMTKSGIFGGKLSWISKAENYFLNRSMQIKQTDNIAFCSISYICIDLYITHLLPTQSVIKQKNMAEIFVKIYIRFLSKPTKKKKKSQKF